MLESFAAGEDVTEREVIDAWSCADSESKILDLNLWFDLFEHFERFLTDDLTVAWPSVPMVLWHDYQPGIISPMSWTDDWERARWFANPIERAVEPSDLLAYIGQRGERE